MELLNYFKALSDKTRLRLFNILIHHELNVNEIVSVLEMSQPRISRHLKVLLESGLVASRRDGLWIFYSVINNGKGRDFITLIKKFIYSGSEFLSDIERCEKIIKNRSVETIRFFNKVAGDWSKLKQNIIGTFNINETIAQYMRKCRLAVDVGCGTGDLIPTLLSKADTVVGVDRSEKMLEQARKNLSSESARLSLRLGDLEHLPLGDNEADFAVASMVMHHLSSPPDAINEIHRVLKRKSNFLIVDFLKHGSEKMRIKYGDRWLGFEPNEIKKWLKDAKFTLNDRAEFDLQNGLKIILFLSAKQ